MQEIKRSLDNVLNAPQRSEPEGFLLRLAKALHTFGLPAYELEKLIQGCGNALGFGVQSMSLTTSISITFLSANDATSTFVIRVDPGVVNLEKLRLVTEVAQQVIDENLAPQEGAAQLAKILEAKPLYSGIVQIIALALISFGIARIFSGGLTEMLIGGFLGGVVGGVIMVVEKLKSIQPLLDSLCALVVVVMANSLLSLGFEFSYYPTVISALIILIPGFNLTIAITELATQNLVSGTARFSGAIIAFLQLGFGFVIGEQISTKIFTVSKPQVLSVVPDWTTWVALTIACIGLVAPFNARLKDCFWFIVAGIIAFGASQLFTHHFGASLAAFFSAICVGISANLVKRYFNQAGSTIMLPGFLILVPGSIGFRSILAMVENDLTVAAEVAFSAIMTGLSLVLGLLISSMTTFNFRKE